ncbi:MAG: gliding motility-associated C-terminal domain-containing protein [Saprospiraceae bacterium]
MRLMLLLTLMGGLMTLTAQIGVQVVVQNGSATSDCTDPFGLPPDPLFAVSVEGLPYRVYPEEGACFNSLPDTAFFNNYSCLAELPIEVEVCLRVTENDALFQPPLGCDIVESCTETICDNFIVPPFGTTVDYTLSLDVPGSTSGTVTFSIETGGFLFPNNDLICDAVDLGTLAYGDTIGNQFQGIYSNLCATNTGEPNPLDMGYYYFNNAGVWFHFRTASNPGGYTVIQVQSDPQMTGEEIDIELGVFTTDDGTCSGVLDRIQNYNFFNSTFDMEFLIPCLDPDTDYYIQIDGSNNNGDYTGIFGLQIWDVGVAMGGDLRCDAWDLGTVSEGGQVMTPEPVGNFCATSLQDPFLPTFVSQHSVWFSFVAPPSGHVRIEAVSDTVKAPIDLQLALYRPFNDNCTGFFSYVTSAYDPVDYDETMIVSCLYPGRRYFILVDGGGGASRGVFELSVTDAGDITPVTNQTLILCDGESVDVGANTYTTTGIYNDTLQVFQGCDSIVITNLTVLPPLTLEVVQTRPAIGLGGLNAHATATAMGGTESNYTFQWCNGETGATATLLEGGTNCCVTVTDDNGCEAVVCFEVEYTTAIIPTFENDTLVCFGNTDGVVAFSVENGIPPYSYQWQQENGSLSGDGSIANEGGMVAITGLPAGVYTVMVMDEFLDTTFQVLVVQPDELVVTPVTVQNVSCYGFCDGSLEVAVEGGVGAYTFSWTNAVSTNEILTGLCAGNYAVTVTDENACTATFSTPITQPAEFIATATVVQEVSCYEGNDGIIAVTDNGSSMAWNWSSGAQQAQVNQLPTGTYEVTVTNSDGCMDTTAVFLPQPLAPLTATIDIAAPVSCFGSQDGSLVVQPGGPFQSLNYDWNSGSSIAVSTGLSAGEYEVTITNEKGCIATAEFELPQPDAITANVYVEDINCLDGPNAGAIMVEDVSGGTPGYQYALMGGGFGSLPLFDALMAGSYEVVVRDAAGCELEIPAIVMPPPPISVVLQSVGLEEDETIRLGDVLTLQALTESNDAVFDWSYSDTVQTGVVQLTPLGTDLYQVIVTDTVTFCSATDLLRVFVDKTPRIFVPNIFSPNGDGNNDYFLPLTGQDVSRIVQMQIFARSGQLVYQQANLPTGISEMGWDGTFQGQMLNPGVFVYMAEIEFVDGRREVIRGDLTLVR